MNIDIERAGRTVAVRRGRERAELRCRAAPIAVDLEARLRFWAERPCPWTSQPWGKLAELAHHAMDELDAARAHAQRRAGRRAA